MFVILKSTFIFTVIMLFASITTTTIMYYTNIHFRMFISTTPTSFPEELILEEHTLLLHAHFCEYSYHQCMLIIIAK